VMADDPVPAAAEPAGHAVPRKDVLPVPSEVPQGTAALVLAVKAQPVSWKARPEFIFWVPL
jgi:hypothetical protein